MGGRQSSAKKTDTNSTQDDSDTMSRTFSTVYVVNNNQIDQDIKNKSVIIQKTKQKLQPQINPKISNKDQHNKNNSLFESSLKNNNNTIKSIDQQIHSILSKKHTKSNNNTYSIINTHPIEQNSKQLCSLIQTDLSIWQLYINELQQNKSQFLPLVQNHHDQLSLVMNRFMCQYSQPQPMRYFGIKPFIGFNTQLQHKKQMQSLNKKFIQQKIKSQQQIKHLQQKLQAYQQNLKNLHNQIHRLKQQLLKQKQSSQQNKKSQHQIVYLNHQLQQLNHNNKRQQQTLEIIQTINFANQNKLKAKISQQQQQLQQYKCILQKQKQISQHYRNQIQFIKSKLSLKELSNAKLSQQLKFKQQQIQLLYQQKTKSKHLNLNEILKDIDSTLSILQLNPQLQ